jgi:hypothetical protein
MNMLLPPLVASTLLAGYVATITDDHLDGEERRYATDNMVRYHTLAVEEYNTTLATVPEPVMAPFAEVLDWRSQRVVDSTGRIWIITYAGDGPATRTSSIGETAVTSIPYELARKRYSGGTYGVWKDNALETPMGIISFANPLPQPVPDGAPVIATLVRSEA